MQVSSFCIVESYGFLCHFQSNCIRKIICNYLANAQVVLVYYYAVHLPSGVEVGVARLIVTRIARNVLYGILEVYRIAIDARKKAWTKPLNSPSTSGLLSSRTNLPKPFSATKVAFAGPIYVSQGC